MSRLIVSSVAFKGRAGDRTPCPKEAAISTTASRFESNQLLTHLSRAESLWLEQDLERVELATGSVLYSSGAVVRHVYFPGTATVSLVSSMANGASAEVAVVGSEGMVGVCAFMGDTSALSDAVVQRPGHAWSMSTAAVLHHTRRSPDFMQQLLGYTQALFTQMAQASACNRHHSLDQQLCRWLLQHLDRQVGHELQVTQERMAGLLGVRREGVTCAAIKLQKAGLISYRRGRICIHDRAGLEARACECYGVVRQAYERLSNRRSQTGSTPAQTDTDLLLVHRGLLPST